MDRKIKVGSKVIDDNTSVFIIAEIGINHNGNLNIAKELIDASKISGADCVKFQTFQPERMVTQNAPNAKY